MSRAAEFYEGIRRNPFAVLEFIWGLALIVDGFYLLLPAYEAKPGSVLVAFTGEPEVATFIAAFYVFTGTFATIAAMLGNYALRNWSQILLFMAFFFTVLLRLLSVGFTPTVWVWPALLAVTAAVANWNHKWNRSQP